MGLIIKMLWFGVRMDKETNKAEDSPETEPSVHVNFTGEKCRTTNQHREGLFFSLWWWDYGLVIWKEVCGFFLSFLFWLHCMACISYYHKFPNQGLKTHPDEIGHVQGGMTVDKTHPLWKHIVLIHWTFREFPENKDFDFLSHTTFPSILD